jgi:hypothetical protein
MLDEAMEQVKNRSRVCTALHCTGHNVRLMLKKLHICAIAP